jgi:hypothetical protein
MKNDVETVMDRVLKANKIKAEISHILRASHSPRIFVKIEEWYGFWGGRRDNKDNRCFSMLPTRKEMKQGITAVDKAISFLTKEGAKLFPLHYDMMDRYHSSQLFQTSASSEGTLELEIHYFYYLKDFSEDEKEQIFNKV